MRMLIDVKSVYILYNDKNKEILFVMDRKPRLAFIC